MELILANLTSAKCFEWGPGNSTEIMVNHDNVVSVDSVESDKDYLDMVQRKFRVSGTNFMLEDVARLYPLVRGDNEPYDFIFIDGRYRSGCLYNAHKILKSDGIVMLHDAEREEYSSGIRSYYHEIWMDNGNTVVLINDRDKAAKIRHILSRCSS